MFWRYYINLAKDSDIVNKIRMEIKLWMLRSCLKNAKN